MNRQESVAISARPEGISSTTIPRVGFRTRREPEPKSNRPILHVENGNTPRGHLMLPSDPEREALGRSIAAVLMAKQIRQVGQIHPETILTEIGALAGFAA